MHRQGCLVLLRYAVGADMDYLPAARHEAVADQPAVASAPLALRAHDGRGPLAGKALEALEAGGELGRLHVLRVATEGGVAPGTRATARARLAPPAELVAEWLVGDPRGPERLAQGIHVELRVPPRTGVAPHVANDLHVVPAKETDEPLDLVGRVADRPDLLR